MTQKQWLVVFAVVLVLSIPLLPLVALIGLALIYPYYRFIVEPRLMKMRSPAARVFWMVSAVVLYFSAMLWVWMQFGEPWGYAR